MKGINEGAIRHDVALDKKYGMSGLLLVGECGTTLEELKQVAEIAVDEAGGELHLVAHACLPTLADNVELARHAESVGVDYVLLSYPLTFYPVTEREVVDYSKAIADSTDLGLIVFAMDLWNFRRLHPSGFSPELIGRLIDEIPTVVAVKNETGAPGVGGMAQVFMRHKSTVVVGDPIEANAPAWCSTYGMQWIGTSNYEAFAGEVPRYFELLQQGEFEAAMEIFWRIHPMRQADFEVVTEALRGTSLVPRLAWKYEGWLNGFNGGPIRSPHHRLNDRQMGVLRGAHARSGLPVHDGTDAEFFVGRNPA
jgi:dihydrodipicolinate synthase/N-acetylneuraminate lyase